MGVQEQTWFSREGREICHQEEKVRLPQPSREKKRWEAGRTGCPLDTHSRHVFSRKNLIKTHASSGGEAAHYLIANLDTLSLGYTCT